MFIYKNYMNKYVYFFKSVEILYRLVMIVNFKIVEEAEYSTYGILLGGNKILI